MTMREFTIERTFNAPRELVWRAFTDPQIATQWYHPHGVTSPQQAMSFDVREGGSYAYLMVGPDGTEYPTAGSYLTVHEPERLRFTWREPGDADEGTPVVDVRLAETPEGGTAMTFHLSRLDDTRVAADSVQTGWSQALQNLNTTLEGLR